MTEPHDPDPAERAELTERDLAIATLVGRYIERRDRALCPRVHDLIAAAAEFGDGAVDELRTVLAFYEAMRSSEDNDRCSTRMASAWTPTIASDQ